MVNAHSPPTARGGSHHIGTQFRVRTLISSLITAIIGAVVLVVVVRAIKKV